ncbi:hypothetical protein BKA62DRAFT_676962 [Auriculariales sp. MPI-PUGE-AT-0066]|nr:hypothetical protein BKA62DRAFT_676962 [Auriculariales sp. MPI-PUGE-AT-0066]
MDSMRVVAGPVDPVGRLEVASYHRRFFRPPARIVAAEIVGSAPVNAPNGTATDCKPFSETSGITQLHSATYSNTSTINSTGVQYAWSVTEVGSRTDFPATPAEPAGPLQANGVPALSNTRGSIRVFISCKDREFRAWVLDEVLGEVQWVSAVSGHLHPNQTLLRGYKLSLRNPRAPSWVNSKTHKEYGSRSKKIEWWTLPARG